MNNTKAYAVGIAMLLVLVVVVAGPSSFTFGFLPWVAVPFLLQLWMARKAKKTSSQITTKLISWLLLLFSYFLYYEIFKGHPDALSGVALIFLPWYQLSVCLVTFILVLIIDGQRKAANKKDTPELKAVR